MASQFLLPEHFQFQNLFSRGRGTCNFQVEAPKPEAKPAPKPAEDDKRIPPMKD
jgi:hypothetical protein